MQIGVTLGEALFLNGTHNFSAFLSFFLFKSHQSRLSDERSRDRGKEVISLLRNYHKLQKKTNLSLLSYLFLII